MWVNRKATHQYRVEWKREAGVVLVGAEVKSIRKKGINIANAYGVANKQELWLYNAHISHFQSGLEFDNCRPRKLLMSRKEINKIIGFLSKPGYTLIPLRVYFNNNGLFKAEIGVCVGKTKHDKRAAEKEKEIIREFRKQR